VIPVVGRIVGVKEAHRKLPSLLRDAEAGKQIVVSRKGKPVAVVIGVKEYNSMMATLGDGRSGGVAGA